MRTLVLCLSVLSLISAAEVRVPLERGKLPGEAADFPLLDATGKAVALSRFEGKPVLLDLWATKCGGCVKEIPLFIETIAHTLGMRWR